MTQPVDRTPVEIIDLTPTRPGIETMARLMAENALALMPASKRAAGRVQLRGLIELAAYLGASAPDQSSRIDVDAIVMKG
jgi:hypothetical protein